MVGDVLGNERAVGAATRPSFEQVYQDRHVAVVRLATVMVGSSAIGEELAQDAFIRLMGAWDRVQNPAGFLHTTVANLCRTHLKRTAHGKRITPDRVPADAGPVVDETWSALARLAPKYRVVLALRFYEDMSEAETAAALGLRLGTVKSQVHRGLAALRKELA